MLRRAAPLALTLAALCAVLALAEGVLRAWPGLIDREVLMEFHPAPRARVAERLGLPLKQARLCLGPEERLDHGPDLCLIAPGTAYRFEAVPEDLAIGAQERLPHDARGFCNPPAVAARPRADVVALGDSFTWCTAVAADDAWPAQLERRTGQAVYNLGVPGVGVHEYVEVLERFGLALAPRVVVVAVYGGNDLRDALHFQAQRARAGEPSRAERTGPLATLMRSSYALNFVAGAVEVLADRLNAPRVDFSFFVTHDGREVEMNTVGGDLDEVGLARAFADGRADLLVWDEPLARLAALAAEAGFRVLVAYLPSAHVGYAPGVRFSDPSVGAAVVALDEAQRRVLGDLSNRHGFTYVDCTRTLQAGVAGSALAYFPGNLHPTPSGHALIAACVEAAIGDEADAET